MGKKKGGFLFRHCDDSDCVKIQQTTNTKIKQDTRCCAKLQHIKRMLLCIITTVNNVTTTYHEMSLRV